MGQNDPNWVISPHPGKSVVRLDESQPQMQGFGVVVFTFVSRDKISKWFYKNEL